MTDLAGERGGDRRHLLTMAEAPPVYCIDNCLFSLSSLRRMSDVINKLLEES